MSDFLYPLSNDSYLAVKAIYSGRWCTVFTASSKSSGSTVVLKMLKGDPNKPKKKAALIVKDLNTLLKIAHNNIVPIKDGGLFQQGWQIPSGLSCIPEAMVVMEFYRRGNLDKIVDARAPGEIDEAWNYDVLNQILSGLAYLHSMGMLHGDIKASNVLFSGSTAKLSDFGYSDWEGRTVVGNSVYAAPEAFASAVSGSGASSSGARSSGAAYTTKSDIFSVGILCVRLFTEADSFKMWMRSVETNTKTCRPPFYKHKFLPSSPYLELPMSANDTSNPEWAIKASQMWKYNPAERKNAADLLNANLFR